MRTRNTFLLGYIYARMRVRACRADSRKKESKVTSGMCLQKRYR